ARMTVFDIDGGLRFYPQFLTKLANALPFVTTDAPSSLNLTGEIAQSHPNPNVDGAAYIDDFESAFEELNLGTMRTSWQLASLPDKVPTGAQRGKTLWHSAPAISINDVYNRDIGTGQTGALNPFRIVFRPRTIKLDSIPQADSTWRVDSVRVPSWGGLTSLLSGVDAYRAKLFEIRAKGKRGVLHFDFGKISEDINGDGILNQEAEDYKTMSKELDVGLDGKSDAQEGATPQNPDPAGDNWYSGTSGKCPLPGNVCDKEPYKTRFSDPQDSLFYEFLNGTEGNFDDASHLGMPDRESFSQYNPFNTTNSYFSYKIDLADLSSDSSRYVAGSDLNGWRTYRIPIMDPAFLDTTVGGGTLPTAWSDVTHVRVWWESDSTQTEPDTVEIAAWYIVQSNWQDSLEIHRQSAVNTRFVVASVSEEDGTFQAPPDVKAYTDKTTGATEARRGLSLHYEGIAGGKDTGDVCIAYKRLPSIDRYSGYRRLQMYVYGDTSAADAGQMQVFLRLGRDESNFYEYHADLYPRWDSRNFIDMDFNVATALKNAAQKALPPNASGVKIDTTDGNYRVVGDPNINEVRFFAVGLINKNTDKERSGTVWLDELRVSDVRRDVGTAARFDINGKVADLLDYSFGWRAQNPYFRGISATTRGGSQDNLGSGSTDRGYNYNLSLSFQKFLPRSWNASVPIGFSYNKSTQVPVLRTASDIVLPQEVRNQEKSESVTKSFRAAESFDKKGSNPLFTVLLNRQKLNFSYVRTQNMSVNRPYGFGESFSVGGQFSMTVSKVPTLPLFSWAKSIPILNKTKGTRLSLYPTRWEWSFGFDRSVNVSDDISRKRTSSFSRGLDGRMNMEYKVFENLNLRFDLTTKRDLSDPTQVNWSLRNFKPGLETNFSQNFSGTYAPRFFGWLGTGFSYTANYNDNYERSTKTRGSTLSRSWGVAGDLKHLVLLGRKDQGGRGGQQNDAQRKQPTTGLVAKAQPQEQKKSGPKRSIWGMPFALARFLTGWFDPITYRYNETYNNSLPGMAIRPGLKYRFGLQDKAGVTLIGDSRTPVATEGSGLELGSRFRLLGGIITDVKYRNGMSRDLARQGSAAKRVSTVWPDLEITISKFSVLPLIKKPVNKFIDVFRPRTGFTRESKKTIDIAKGWVTDKSTSSDYNPLLAVEFRLFRALSMSASYTLQSSRLQQFNPASGVLSTEQHATQRGITITSRYSFRSPTGIKIPIFGKLKITSLMNIEVSVRKNSTTNRSWSPSQGWYEENKSDFMVSPNITYEFSQAIKGGLSGIWQDISDTKTKSHVRMLQIFVEVRF
ncbi:cell surface protein SprA, partial [candidate division GN15 bacterium]